jgi:acetyl-CoA acetyltransferase
MIDTAENVAREANISTEEQHEMALLRYEQYENALKNNAAFQARYMVVPIEVNPSTRKLFVTVTGDEGVRAATSEGLAGLRPVLPNGTVTHGAQTYPADGNAGMVLTTREAIAHLSRDTKIVIRLLSFAQARERKGFMPAAVIPAAQKALDRAGVGIRELKAIKTHNPFAVNDILFSRVMGVNPGSMNNFGSSLIWGHPQGPTGMRLIIELIEELIMAGGGYGLFTGCSAGDSAAAVVVKVDSRQPAIV